MDEGRKVCDGGEGGNRVLNKGRRGCEGVKEGWYSIDMKDGRRWREKN